MKVWIAYHEDYEQSHITAVASTKEGAVDAVKARYGDPYIVKWTWDGDESLTGDFEQVLGFSTQHMSYYSIWEYDVYEALPDPTDRKAV